MDYAVILAGGSGTRLWPMSRKNKPKQFYSFMGEKTLLQETFERINTIMPAEKIFISTLEKFKDEIIHQLPQILQQNIIAEPSSKNTGPALGLIATVIAKKNKDAIVGTFASDHVVLNNNNFKSVVESAYKAIKKYPDRLIAIGLKPTKPDTGLGYIKMGRSKSKILGNPVFEVSEFVEKPDLKTAQKFISGWEYLWNACYYVFKASEMLKWFKEFDAPVAKKLERIGELLDKSKGEDEIRKIYNSLDEVAIEYAIVNKKKFKKVLVMPADLGWSDIGTWSSLFEMLSEQFGSNIVSRGHHIDYNSKNCLVYSNDKLIATVGMQNTIIVDVADATLILNKENAQEIKELLLKMKNEGKHFYL